MKVEYIDVKVKEYSTNQVAIQKYNEYQFFTMVCDACNENPDMKLIANDNLLMRLQGSSQTSLINILSILCADAKESTWGRRLSASKEPVDMIKEFLSNRASVDYFTIRVNIAHLTAIHVCSNYTTEKTSVGRTALNDLNNQHYRQIIESFNNFINTH